MKFFLTFFFADEKKKKKICEKVIKFVLVVRGYKKNLEVGRNIFLVTTAGEWIGWHFPS